MTTSLVAAGACRVPWGPAANGLPGAAPAELPGLTGFVLSRFNPLIADVVVDCLGEPGSPHDLTTGRADRTAIVLATTYGDTTTSDVATQRLVAGQVHSPLLFFQSVTTSVLGHLARQYGITGPISCISTGADPAAEALTLADLLLAEDDADQVLVVGVETAANERVDWIRERVDEQGGFGPLPHGDAAVALLLRRGGEGTAAPKSRSWPQYGWLAPLVQLITDHDLRSSK